MAKESYQTRGINGLRREGEHTKILETKAAATHAKIALGTGVYKLFSFMFL